MKQDLKKQESIEKKTIRIVSEFFGIDPQSIDRNTKLADLSREKTDIWEILMGIDEEFDTYFEIKVDKIVNVGQLVDIATEVTRAKESDEEPSFFKILYPNSVWLKIIPFLKRFFWIKKKD